MTVAESFDQCYRKDRKGCFVWQRARAGKEAKRGGGYGCFRLGSKVARAHTFAWERVNGPVPKGLQVRHTCHNTLCVNVEHMLLGTNDDNARDRLLAGRYQKKLTPAKVRAIRHAAEKGESQNGLARKYGVCGQTVNEIVKRDIWRHV